MESFRRRRLWTWLQRLALALQLAAAGRLVDWLLRIVARTSRTVALRPEYDLDRRGEPCIVVALHQALFYQMHYFRNRGAVVMASRSRDGDFVSAVLGRLGFHVARGSDLRGGAQALGEMIEFLREGRGSAGLTCDGPRGPYGAVKPGVVKLARETGRPLVPCALWASRKLLLRNWDRTLIPLPFSRIVLCFGSPIEVPKDAEWSDMERICDELVREMAALLQEAQSEADGIPPG